MGTSSRSGVARERAGARLAAVLSALGCWTIVVPYLGHAIGLGVDVASKVEVVDHVVPGALVAATGGCLLMLTRRRVVVGGWPTLLGGGAGFLAGVWVLATHVPLLADAARGNAPWGAALWHASTSLPIVLVSLWYVLRGPEGDSQS